MPIKCLAQCLTNNESKPWGPWVAQSVKRLTLAQVTISQIHGLEPGAGLRADSSEPGACFGFCVSLSAPPLLILSLFLSQK